MNSKTHPAGNYKLEEATGKQHKAQTRSVIQKNVAEGHIPKNTLQANHKLEEATRKQHKPKARSVIKTECGRRPHSKKYPAGKS